MSDKVTIKRALISVSDKKDLVAFAKKLEAQGVEIISTGGTFKALDQAGVKVIAIDQVTQFPEMMDGRVKTLHPRIHGGLLGLRDNPAHLEAMAKHGIEPIDLVCVNLYPFEQTIARKDVSESQAIEQIDIGGPSMLRSASKNFQSVVVVTDPEQYDLVASQIEEYNGATKLNLRRKLALAAFAKTAAYDTAIATWMANSGEEGFSDPLLLKMKLANELRYGENPHQNGALYVDPKSHEASVAKAKQLHGKELSFNNLYDANGALELVKEVCVSQAAAAAVIKHANPCGFAISQTLVDAFERAYQGDPLAAFGGIVAMNRTVDLATAEKIVEGQKFLEVIVAPGFEDQALELIRGRWKNVRILAVGDLGRPEDRDLQEREFKKITGGILVQDRDLKNILPEEWEHAAGPKPDDQTIEQMRVAMVAVKHLKSNAVCLVNDHALVGAGAGQMDRVASCQLAIQKAGQRANGAIVGSDAFFPFRDGPDLLIAAGVKAIAQPGGSKRDEETITACQEAGVTLMLTHTRHFRH